MRGLPISTQSLKDVCAESGGSDITGKGTLTLDSGVTAAIVCQTPRRPGVQSMAPARPADGFFYGSAVLHPPSGAATVDASEQFTATCSVTDSIPVLPGVPAVSNGNSTFNCRGYNLGETSLGCSVQWTGLTPVTLGVDTDIELSFNCLVSNTANHVSSAMDYSYADPTYQRINFSGSATGVVAITHQ